MNHSHCEPLETRRLFDGSVVATVVDGDLIIIGDPAANRIMLDGEGLLSTEIRIRSEDTSVNDQFGEIVITGVTRDIKISLRDGDDVLDLEQLHAKRDLRIFTRQGADRITVEGVGIERRLHVES